MNIEVLTHSSILVKGSKVIYFDPFNIKEANHDADIIFVTHDHFDHFSPKDIEMVKKNNTVFVFPYSLKGKHDYQNVYYMNPYDKLTINGIEIEARPAYNMFKKFHPKENRWVGYIVKMDKESIYVMGDTDNLKENQDVKVDNLLIPIGGTYTMDILEASEFTNIVKPKKVIPTHYGSVVGSSNDGNEFKKHINNDISVEIIMKY